MGARSTKYRHESASFIAGGLVCCVRSDRRLRGPHGGWRGRARRLRHAGRARIERRLGDSVERCWIESHDERADRDSDDERDQHRAVTERYGHPRAVEQPE